MPTAVEGLTALKTVITSLAGDGSRRVLRGAVVRGQYGAGRSRAGPGERHGRLPRAEAGGPPADRQAIHGQQGRGDRGQSRLRRGDEGAEDRPRHGRISAPNEAAPPGAQEFCQRGVDPPVRFGERSATREPSAAAPVGGGTRSPLAILRRYTGKVPPLLLDVMPWARASGSEPAAAAAMERAEQILSLELKRGA